ncbi:hypothetical protein COO60DRAFT_1704014 [Scenedesmus sp. NREL 46B-D3]|nr:hypothetical protein COO60DRAFT_1704014 [Scenedesmus sp. NREL 46B-D3]
MLNTRSLWNALFKPATAKFTLEELRELYGVLVRNPVVTESNRAVVVETIRRIAEYMIWGDQHEPRIFDFFLENNIMTYLHRVLLQPANRSGEVAKQVLQTLSIIIQNVRSETAVFFLFSNNHLNNIEVLGYYISFLKTISLKLNPGTVQFFINAHRGDAAGTSQTSFPLYTRAIKLAHNREGMVRAAVRTLTLHVYSVADPDIVTFVTSPPASRHFTEVALYLAEQILLLDKRLLAAEAGGSQLAEVEDVLSYVSDLLSLGVPGISQLLASSVWQHVTQPLLLKPLMQPGAATAAAAAAAPLQQQTQLRAGVAAGSSSRGSSSGLGSAAGFKAGSPTNYRGSAGAARALQAPGKQIAEVQLLLVAAARVLLSTSTISTCLLQWEAVEQIRQQQQLQSSSSSSLFGETAQAAALKAAAVEAAEQQGALLTPQQQHRLQAAVDAARGEFRQQLCSMWCEAVFPMLAQEWPISREVLQRPVLRQAAMRCYLAPHISRLPPVPTVSEADLRQVDIQEGYQVDLAPGSAVPCVVSFAPGQERLCTLQVGCHTVQVTRVKGTSQGVSCPSSSSSAAAAEQDASAAAASQASLLRSLPLAVLADPSPGRPQAGIVLSVAPLLGAHPYTDQGVPKWLHVHVRPSVRGLLRVIKVGVVVGSRGAYEAATATTAAAKKGGLLSAMRQLADGHWVLSFPAADRAAGAVQLVDMHVAHLQQLYGQALAPLCGQPQQQHAGQHEEDWGEDAQADAQADAQQQQHQQQQEAPRLTEHQEEEQQQQFEAERAKHAEQQQEQLLEAEQPYEAADMATFTARPAFAGSKLKPAAAQPISRARVVKAMAVQRKPEQPNAGYLAAAAAAAMLLVSSPAIAGPSLSSAAAKPQAELSNAAGKAKQAAKEVGDAVPSARKGAWRLTRRASAVPALAVLLLLTP